MNVPSDGTGLIAAVFLPAGAAVTSIQLEGCDTNGAGLVAVTLRRFGALESSGEALAFASTAPPSNTPGCVHVTDTLAIPHTVDNATNTYLLDASISGTGESTRLHADVERRKKEIAVTNRSADVMRRIHVVMDAVVVG